MRVAGCWLIFGLVLASLPLGAQEGGDWQAQILYAYQTEAANQLANIQTSLRGEIDGERPSAAARYHLAHADYRMARLEFSSRQLAAGKELAECVKTLAPVLKANRAAVEALALRAACYSQLAQISSVEAVLYWRHAKADLDAAIRAEPRNPRARLIRALDGYVRPKLFGGDPERAWVDLKNAAELFDHSPSTDTDAPGWGHADCYLELGRQLAKRGDLLGARNALEKALIAAADFKQAQLALAELGTKATR
jgi:hypothetical protein